MCVLETTTMSANKQERVRWDHISEVLRVSFLSVEFSQLKVESKYLTERKTNQDFAVLSAINDIKLAFCRSKHETEHYLV